jgi:two-component system chemotaxis response regulator CheY
MAIKVLMVDDSETIPILMLTTESIIEMKKRGKAASARGWITKPMNPEKLIIAVQTLVTGNP